MNARLSAAAAASGVGHGAPSTTHRNRPQPPAQYPDSGADDELSEEEPLLSSRRRRSSSLARAGGAALPGSRRRMSMRHNESSLDPITRMVTGEDGTPDSNPWLHNTLSVMAVYAIGAAGWFVSYRLGLWDSSTADDGGGAGGGADDAVDAKQAEIGMVLGYLSALCYLWYVLSGALR